MPFIADEEVQPGRFIPDEEAQKEQETILSQPKVNTRDRLAYDYPGIDVSDQEMARLKSLSTPKLDQARLAAVSTMVPEPNVVLIDPEAARAAQTLVKSGPFIPPALAPELAEPAKTPEELTARTAEATKRIQEIFPSRDLSQYMEVPSLLQKAQEPAVRLPTATVPKDLPDFQAPGALGLKEVAGIYNVAKQLPESFLSPLGMATILLAPFKSGRAAISAFYGTESALSIPDGIRLLEEARKTGDTQKFTEAVGQLVTAGLITAAAAKHLISTTVPVMQGIARPEVMAEQFRTIKLPDEATKEDAWKMLVEMADKRNPVQAAQPSTAVTAPVELPKPEEPTPEQKPIIGLGGAVPSEFLPSRQTATGINNAQVDAERQSRGQEPIMGPQRQSNEVTWDKAMAKIDVDPAWQDRLIAELKEKPRTPSAEEIVALDHRYADLQNEYAKTTREGALAYEEGRMEDVADLKEQASFWEKELTDLESISRKVGTEWGRSGQMRQRLLREDFTLAAMEARMRAAKGFQPLTESEHAKISELQEQLSAAQKIAEDALQKADLERAKAAAAPLYAPGVLAKAEQFAKFMDQKAEAAVKRLKERLARTSAGVDPTILGDLSVIGAAKLTRGIVDVAKWTDAMAKDVGEWVRAHAKETYAASQTLFESELGNFGKTNKLTKDSETKVRNAIADLPKRIEELKAKEAKRHQPIELDYETAKAKAKVDALKSEYHQELAKAKYEMQSKGEKLWSNIKEGANLPRHLLTSFDFSAVFRQGGFIALGNPVRALRNIWPMFKSLSKEQAQILDTQLHIRPNAPLYERGKLFLAPLEGEKLSGREEAFMSKFGAKIPGVGASNRAYLTFLNRLRADTFDALYRDLSKKGVAPSQVELEAIGNYINVATGRGNLYRFAPAAETLASVFFAPKLVASRFQLLGGQPLYHGTARTRYLVAREYGKFLAGLGVVYGLGQLGGGTLETDPRSTDFGKIKFGNTRVDPMTGLSQASVLMSRLGTGEMKGAKGQVYPIVGKVPYGKSTATDVIGRFLRTKLAPVPGTLLDLRQGQNVVGEKVTPASLITPFAPDSMITPLAFGDILKAMEDQGIERGAALGLLSIFGMGLQTYDAKKK